MKRVLLLIVVLAGLVACKSKKQDVPPPSLYFATFPNPTMGDLLVDVDNKANESAMLRVFDNRNKLISENTVASGKTNLQLDLTQKEEGVYKVVLSTSKNNYSQNIVLVKPRR